MATFGGNFLCRTSLGLQGRVLLIPWMKKSSGIRSSIGKANSSSFPVKYIPKKIRSAEKLQTSSTTMKGPKDEVIMNGFGENELEIKSSQTEKRQTSSTTIRGPKNKISTNGLDENELRFEVSNGGKSSQRSFILDKKSQNQNQIQTPVLYFTPDVNQGKYLISLLYFIVFLSIECMDCRDVGSHYSYIQYYFTHIRYLNILRNILDFAEVGELKSRSTEKLQTSCTTMKGPKDEVIIKGFEGNELSLEVPNERKDSQTEKLPTSSTTSKGPKNKISTNGLDENELRFEVSNGGKSSQRSFVLDKKSQNQNQIQTPIHYSTPDVNQEVGEGIDFDKGLLETECIEEREEVLEELDMYEKNLHTQGVLQVGKTEQDAENLAIELLAMRAYTAVELRKKLLGKRFPLDTVDAVILDFQSRLVTAGLINDGLFAETFCQSRWSSSSWGPRRIKQALLQKGVREADAEKAINYVFKDSNSDGEEESTHGLSKTSIDKLLAQASKQWLRGRDATKETRKTRIIRWLQYRGFNWGVVNFIVKKLESQYPP
ncbi:hypothetical protein RHGRI_009388 [Rhododendron griersonianum]|uniref:Regulatory protein RecX n=1 Tax=Rhododendron griersonianum TaxID=479676 RepID=A0AAV6KEM4_9ERIC|nr:hypothetical protein RHGRI_009388 [Rhododendron griersonianum]